MLLVAASGVSLLFGATPFLIPEVARRYGVTLGAAGLISVSQVSAFAFTTFLAGRWWRPTRSKLVIAAAVGSVFDAASALTGWFPLLLGFRFWAGAAAGVFTWLAWSAAMRDISSMRDVAAIGPITVLFGAPVLAWIASVGGDQALYWLLAVSVLPVMVMRADFTGEPPRQRRRMSPSRSNVVLLIALGILTLAGSSLFVFVGALASVEVGMGAVASSLGFSVNAVAGLVAARWRRRSPHAWPWLAVVAVSAGSLVAFPHPMVFYAGMFWWGFAFWRAVPRVLVAVAEWSLVAEERVGDAQSIMAIGRAIGPGVGGLLLGAGAFGPLGIFTAVGLGLSAVLVAGVERYRSGREAPVPSGV